MGVDLPGRLGRAVGRLARGGSQALLDALVEDACVICRRPTGVGAAPTVGPFADAWRRPVVVRHFRWVAIENHPLCAWCLQAFSPARATGRLGEMNGEVVATVRGERFRVEGRGPGAARAAEAVGVIAPFMTDDNVLKIIHLIKFSGYRELAGPVAACVHEALRRWYRPAPSTRVVTVPMAAADRRAGRFNLAEEIGRRVADESGICFSSNALEKARRTARQSQTAADKRADNVRGAFVPAERLDGGDVLLVDDLVTTGATAGACVASLAAAGATRVTVACFGRAM